MLSIFEIILLFVVALGCIIYCQMGLYEFSQKDKVMWLVNSLVASFYLTMLFMMFTDLIKN